MAIAYEKTCALCGKLFIAKSNNAKYCVDCRYKGGQLKIKQLRAARKKRKIHKSLNDIMWDLAEYNKKHKTNLSYGKYVQLLESGEIK